MQGIFFNKTITGLYRFSKEIFIFLLTAIKLKLL